MYNVKFSFAYIYKSGLKEHHLFAFMDGPFAVGEPTSDFLAFFGFGSSNYDGNPISPILRDSKIVVFGQEKNRYSLFADTVREIQKNYFVDDEEITRAFNYLSIASESVPVNIDVKRFSANTGSENQIHLGFCCGVDRRGYKFFCLEVPEKCDVPSVNINDFDEFNWQFSTRLGDWNHINGILNKMKTGKFTKQSLEKQNAYIDNLKYKAMQICNF